MDIVVIEPASRRCDLDLRKSSLRVGACVLARGRFFDGTNSVNIEPAPQTTSKAPPSQDNWRSTPDGSAVSSRVESISFSIGEEQYGVDIMAVREIKGWSEITHLPKQPDYVRGVLNLRGVMVPIIDLRCRFGQGKTEATAFHVVIIVQVEARLVGLLADRVLDILSFEATQVQAVPQIARSSRVDFLSGLVTIDGTMIALVDLPNLLAERPGEDDADPAAGSTPATPAKGLI
jgi:purine-binding chemotaxis protein CheW